MMDSFLPMKISASGLHAQRIRMNTIASNLANINTTRTENGIEPYRRKDVIFRATPVSFDSMVESGIKGLGGRDSLLQYVRSVEVVDIVEDNSQPIVEFDPGHPDADEEGYVRYPNISMMKEMVNMIAAARAYESNLAVMKTTKNMIDKAINILGV